MEYDTLTPLDGNGTGFLFTLCRQRLAVSVNSRLEKYKIANLIPKVKFAGKITFKGIGEWIVDHDGNGVAVGCAWGTG